MAATTAIKQAKAADGTTFPVEVIDRSGVGTGPNIVEHAATDSQGLVIDPATKQNQATIITALGAPAQDATLSGLATTLTAISGKVALATSQTTQQTTLAAINTAIAGLLQAGGSVTVSNLPATQSVSFASAPTVNVGTTGGIALDASVTAGNALLSSLLTTLQAQRVETLWTDDSGAFYVRTDKAGTLSWLDISGNTVSAPGTGARPAEGSSTFLDKDSFQATAAATGYAINDYIDHVIVLDPATGAKISSYWYNLSQEAKLASAPSGANLTPVSPLAAGAATLSAQLAGNTVLSNILTALGTPFQAGGSVTITSSALPAGAATSAAQSTGNASLSTLVTNSPALVSGRVPVDGSAVTQPISASSLPIPAGASTSALQTTGNTSLATIASNTPAVGATTASASSPVALATDQLSTLATKAQFPATLGGKTSALSTSIVPATDAVFAVRPVAWQPWIANTSGTGFASGDRIIELFAIDDSASSQTLVSYSFYNATQRTLLGTVPTQSALTAPEDYVTSTVQTSLTSTATAQSLQSQLLGFQRVGPVTLGALNAVAVMTGGPYGSVGFSFTTTNAIMTVSAFGMRDGTNYLVPLSITTETATGSSVSGFTLTLASANVFGYVESAGCSAVQFIVSAYTSGSAVAYLDATLQSRSIRVKAPYGEPLAAGGQFNSTPPTLTTGQTSVLQLDPAGNLKISGSLGQFNTTLPTVTSGSFTPLQTDSNGRLLVSGGAATTVTYNTTAPTLTNGQTAALQSDTNGNLKVALASGSITVGSGSVKTSVTPTVTAAAYAANNVVGGTLTFSNAFGSKGSGILQTAVMLMKSAQTAGFNLTLFGAAPTGTYTDKTAPAPSAADLGNIVGVVQFTSALSPLGTHTVYQGGGLNIGMANGASVTTLYGVLTTTGAPIFGTTADILSIALIPLDD